MTGTNQAVGRKFNECQSSEIDAFIALVHAGNAVDARGLKGRMSRAESLVFLTVDSVLSGAAGLKKPDARYRAGVALKSKITLPEAQFPYELGWVYVIPSARGRGFSKELVREALSASNGAGVFATTRNERMAKTLERFDFVASGESWLSQRDPDRLRLFLRHAVQPATPLTAKDQ